MPLQINGWTLLYHPLFGQRYNALRAEVRRLKRELSAEEFAKYPTVKLAAAVYRLPIETIAADQNAQEIWLRGNLAKFRRAKGHGLRLAFGSSG
ncbi:MAG TPA: type II toxin-antitoxin system YhaV family toxin, partial [Chloroflexota bacterium]|nr:type II toxin-antitoxin system YhaV family toxin [Chloroflexota bacterium]